MPSSLSYVAAMAAAALALSACSAPDPMPEGRATGGPLAALAQPGGQAIAAPRAGLVGDDGRWRATFGFPVCTSGPEVTVEDVRLDGADVAGASATVRSVDAGPDWSPPIGSALGSPPRWREKYADPSGLTGSYAAVGGATVTEPCSDDQAGGPPDQAAYQNLLVTLETTAAGSAASSFHVDYTADGEDYTVEVPWEMVLCGTESDPELCQQ